MMRRRIRCRGYLLVLVAVCVSLLSISYLRLAAASAATDDDAEAEVASRAAYYAAESGLVAAQIKLRATTAPPSDGPWLAGSLDISQARFSVEVLPGKSKNDFQLRSTGKTEGEGGRVIASVIEAQVMRGPGKTWTFRSRKKA